MANATNQEHPINGMMDVTLDKIRQMTDSSTIIGDPIHTQEGTTILPVSKVSMGFASGGSDFVSGKAPKELFGGGSGAGLSIQPVAFLVIREGEVRLIQLADHNATIDRALNMLPDLVDKVSAFLDTKTKKAKKETAKTPRENTYAEQAEVLDIQAVEETTPVQPPVE